MMNKSNRFRYIVALLLLIIFFPVVKAQKKTINKNPSVELSSSQKQQIEIAERLLSSTLEYKSSVEKLVGFKQKEKLAKRKELYELGIVARREVESIEVEINNIEVKIKSLEKELTEADYLLVEAEAAKELAKNPPLPKTPSYQVSSGVIRYIGTYAWSLQDTPVVQKFFQDRFGRSLPISAYGQSPTHDKLGFDHRNCIDVALHPETLEGQQLINFLRGAGIPFQAFNRAITGSSTGPHIHIGKPSVRLTIAKQ